MSTIRKALKLLPKKFKNKSILFIFLLLIATSLETLGIGLIFPLIDLGVNGSIGNDFINNYFEKISGKFNGENLLKTLIFIILAVYFLKAIYLTYFNYWQARFQHHIYKSVTQNLFEIYLYEPISFFNKRK